jgi:DNA replication and repair protein RecF
MRLLSLRAEQFRNLSAVSLAPSAGSTVVVGQNGQGKTNLLEAVYFVLTLKPLRAGRLSELLRFGSARARVAARVQVRGAEREISVELAEGTRQAFVDGKRTSKLEDYFGGASVVAFTPDDLEVVKGSPEARRTFLDRAVFNRFPAYLSESREYTRALKSRNKLLKEGAPDRYLEVYDEALARTGARLWSRRRALLAELAPRAKSAFAEIGRTAAPASFGYAPSQVEGFAGLEEAALQAALLTLLQERTGRDRERRFTSVGPHVDDVTLALGDRPARAFASQGQQRALVLSWKVAEIENLREALGYLPLLLLDDVSSELDPERNGYLMRYLARSGAQVLLTTTDARLVEAAAGADTLWLSVAAGEIRPSASAP